MTESGEAIQPRTELDSLWNELLADALASDGPISDADVKNAVKHYRTAIEDEVRREAASAAPPTVTSADDWRVSTTHGRYVGAAPDRYCVHDELPGDCRVCTELGYDMMPEVAAPDRDWLADVLYLEGFTMGAEPVMREDIDRLMARLGSALPLDVERLNRAILDELAELWGEPADAVSAQVRPQVARSIAERYRLSESGSPPPGDDQ